MKRSLSNKTVVDNFYLEIWLTTIETQRHFNNLIIKFRSLVLSIFLTSLGLIFSLNKQLSTKSSDQISDYCILIVLLLAFWLACFIIDFYYYQKLLIGSVEYGNYIEEILRQKYDSRIKGLTEYISEKIKLKYANLVIILFYVIPALAAFFSLLAKDILFSNFWSGCWLELIANGYGFRRWLNSVYF